MSDPSAAHTQVTAAAETVVGGVLVAAPWWVQLIGEINAILALVTALCGAIVGIVGVVRLWRTRRKPHSLKP
jgi:NADH:ubiquinone oxidoreductase subunit K